jgi:alkanesulfonate monooxygenase SsuD/methylene tetrahydromethanopterin reductase-like flavin-dependent oxidoreductase (luciferase family)
MSIWLGGSGDAAFERAARLADGFIFFGNSGIDHAVDAWNRLRDRVHELGRPVEQFGAEYVALPGDDFHDLTAQIDAWRDAGGTHVSVATMGLGLDGIDGHIDYLASVSDALNLGWRTPERCREH